MYHEVLGNGRLSDRTMAKFGIPVDMASADGKFKDRDTDVESHRRAQVTSHEALVASRLAVVEQRDADRAKKVAVEAAQVKVLLATAEAAEKQIVATVVARRETEMARRAQRAVVLADATITDVKNSKIRVEGLKALIHVRSFHTSKCESSLPKMGTVEEANAGAKTLLRMVHDLKAKPIIIRAPSPMVPTAVPPPLPPTTITITPHGSGSGGGGGGGGGGGVGGGGVGDGGGGMGTLRVPASTWVANKRWLALMMKSTVGAVAGAAVASDTAERADLMATLLEERLRRHILERVLDVAKQDHWVWDWSRENIPRVAAWLAVSGLAIKRVQKISPEGSVLRPSQLTRVSDSNGSLEGSYMHVDEDIVRRSGKVVRKTGGGVLARDAEHRNKALLRTPSDLKSSFYLAYPQRTSTNVVAEAQIGWWDDLELCAGLLFDRADTAAVRALCDTNASRGLLSWRPIHMNRIRAVKFRGGGVNDQDKQLHMVGYLFELIFDLMIAPKDNLSESPGFETPLGVFPK